MARLFEIYRTKDEKFKSYIEKDKNLELIYLFKSFAYLPISILKNNNSPNLFPFDLAYTIATFLDINHLKDPKKISLYIDKLMKSGKYSDILSLDDCNLVKGFIEGFYDYQYEDGDTKAIDTLLALSIQGNKEASSKLIYLYFEKLGNLDKKDDKNKSILKTKIYETFLTLEEEKFYKIYAQYGLFLYHEMHMFDKALEVFEEGYYNNMYECAFCYFHAFTKSENQIIYEPNNFKSQKFVDIFQCLIDAFLYGQFYALDNMFDYLHIMGKKDNLMNQFSNKYMIYLNEIALICRSFTDKEKGVESIKKFTLFDIDILKYASYHALSVIYMYGLTIEVQLNLLKADKYLKKAMEKDEYSHPYYTRLRYKIMKKLFNLGAIQDKREIDKFGKNVFQLYDKYKNHDRYGNSFYYFFGRLYEKGIGTEKNNKLALKYYQKGCTSLNNIYDSFVIVYKRYLSLKIVNSNKFGNLAKKSIPTLNIKFRLSAGNIDIMLPINPHMSLGDIKNELYKKPQLQNYEIKLLLFKGNQLMKNDTLEKFKVKDNETVLVMVENPDNSYF